MQKHTNMDTDVKFLREKDSKELQKLAEYYFEQHKAIRETPLADRKERDEKRMKDYMAKIQHIDKILLEREEH